MTDSPTSPLSRFASVSRFHIVLIAAGGSLVFGRLLTGAFRPSLAVFVALDWFLVNVVNRVVDQVEDRANRIAETDYAHNARGKIYLLAIALYTLSFCVHFFWMPWLALPRAAYHLLGLIYNFRLIPTRDASGRPARTRLKEMYFFKNAASCTGFLLTLFAYPLATWGLAPGISWTYPALLIAYFAPFELSFEIIYDLRDVAGDRLARVASYPVIHGEDIAGRIIVALNIAAVEIILAGGALGLFGWKEIILGVGPLTQLGLFLRGRARGFAPRDCVVITWTFAAMNFGYVAWVLLRLPLDWPWAADLSFIIEVALVAIGLVLWRWLAPLYGRARFARAYGLIALGAWVSEQSCISIYKFYHYADRWDVFIGSVPFAIVLIWPMVIFSTHHLVRRMGLASVRAVLAGAAIVAFEATLIETACVNAGLWFWEGHNVFGVPLIGVLGWSFFALGALAALEFAPGRALRVLPLAGLLTTHLFLQIVWRAGMRGISHTPFNDAAVVMVMAALSFLLTVAAAKRRAAWNISLVEVFPRGLAAQIMFYVLLSSGPGPALALFGLLFAPPYFAVFRWNWAMAGERGVKTL